MQVANLGAFLRRRAEDVAVLLLVAMFLVFMLQIISRYVLSLPMGWTHEISVVLWVWLVLFGAAFVVPDREEMRFDLIYGAVGDKTRRVMGFITAVVAIAAFVVAMPGTWDYVTFMKVESTAYLKIRFDWLYSIYVVFAVAMIIRHIWVGFRAIYGHAPEAYDPTKASSGV